MIRLIWALKDFASGRKKGKTFWVERITWAVGIEAEKGRHFYGLTNLF